MAIDPIHFSSHLLFGWALIELGWNKIQRVISELSMKIKKLKLRIKKELGIKLKKLAQIKKKKYGTCVAQHVIGQVKWNLD